MHSSHVTLIVVVSKSINTYRDRNHTCKYNKTWTLNWGVRYPTPQFMDTHTRVDGTFVDLKAKQVVEAYVKNLEEKESQLDEDGPNNSEDSSQQSTHRTLTIQEKNDLFLKSTVKNDKGNTFGLGRLADTINKGKRKESYGTSSTSSILEMQEQLEAARVKLAKVDEDNAKRDKERCNDRSRISSLEMLVSYLKTTDPGFVQVMGTTNPTATTTATATAATTANPQTAPTLNTQADPTVNTQALPPATPPDPAATSPMSNTSSYSRLA